MRNGVKTQLPNYNTEVVVVIVIMMMMMMMMIIIIIIIIIGDESSFEGRVAYKHDRHFF